METRFQAKDIEAGKADIGAVNRLRLQQEFKRQPSGPAQVAKACQLPTRNSADQGDWQPDKVMTAD